MFGYFLFERAGLFVRRTLSSSSIEQPNQIFLWVLRFFFQKFHQLTKSSIGIAKVDGGSTPSCISKGKYVILCLKKNKE